MNLCSKRIKTIVFNRRFLFTLGIASLLLQIGLLLQSQKRSWNPFSFVWKHDGNVTTWFSQSSDDDAVQSKLTAWQQEMNNRRALLRSQCRKLDWGANISRIPSHMLRHFIVDDKHKLLYCYVPKVSCTVWKSIFFVLTGVRDHNGEPYRDLAHITKRLAHIPGKLPTLSDYKTEEILHRITHYNKLLVVRHPLERILSAYRSKFAKIVPNNADIRGRYAPYIISRFRTKSNRLFSNIGNKSKSDIVTFAEFVQFLIDKESEKFGGNNEHWVSVPKMCFPCSVDFNVIAKSETIERDADYFLRSAKVDHLIQYPTFPPEYVPTSLETADQNYLSVLRQNLAPLYEKYIADFVLFNYSVPELLRVDSMSDE